MGKNFKQVVFENYEPSVATTLNINNYSVLDFKGEESEGQINFQTKVRLGQRKINLVFRPTERIVYMMENIFFCITRFLLKALLS